MGIAYNTSIARDGLLLHLDAANVKSYPSSGTTWSDLSGNGVDGTIIGSPTFTDNYFDITSDATYISVPNATLSHRTNDFTYSIWMLFDATVYYNTVFESGSWGDALIFRFQAGTTFAVYAEGSNLGGFSWTPVTGSWLNLVLRRSSGSANLKINNVSIGNPISMTTDINLANPNLYIMRSQHTGNQFTNGKISSFSVYNRALSDEEVSRNFESYRGRYGV